MTMEYDELWAAITRRTGISLSGGATPAAVKGGASSTTAAPAPAASSPAAGPIDPEDKKAQKKAEKAAKDAEKAAKFAAKKEKPQWGAPKADKAEKKKPEKEKAVVEKDDTPAGEKKDLSKPMAEGYEPSVVEAAWGAWWDKKGFFSPDAKKAKSTLESKKFIMVIPPPNVTGSLHIGHALTTAIEDCLTRWHRMRGDVTLWVPGTDHAGIATQSVVERLLFKVEKKTRHDLGREKFLERVWDWKNKNGNHICHQLRKIAASVDWNRERFTMDDMLSKAVQAAFIQFHDEGKIYRDNRLVNWCPYLRTALSDLEVDHEDLEGKTLVEIPGFDGKVEVGVLCEFKYKIKGSNDFLTVATTRLETMLGDTAVAVHPEDDRYKKFHGKQLEHPFFADRKMVVIADTMVDREFGTGCVKITPAHDPNDFKAGKKHNLEFINIFTEGGAVNELGGEFKDMHRYKARVAVEEALTKKGLWVGKKSHAMRLGFCSRSKDIIEPFLKPQWWMNCKELADKSVKALREGLKDEHGEQKLTIIPEFHHQTWYHWLENIQEWCISRQLWWGHRIPAYKVVDPPQKEEQWFTGKNEAEATEKAKKKLGLKKCKVEQDEDVLDTWFSSGLFPFSVMGWPDCSAEDMQAFFPTSLLETGHDILFFWVARMVMMSLGLTGKLPFHTVYLHAMVRDAHGRKMSKSLGNVIDPLEVVEGITLEKLNDKLRSGNLPEKEVVKAIAGQKADFPEGIPECGADALRFGLLAYTSQGRNVNLDINRVVGYRHFCNKLWNATKFGLKYFNEGFKAKGVRPGMNLQFEDRWILSRLADCAATANKSFENYEFAAITSAVYNFWLYELCDVYLELLKPRFYGEETPENAEDRAVAREVLYTCLDWGLRLLHPCLPFLTEELYQRLPPSPSKVETIVLASYPLGSFGWINHGLEKNMETISSIAKGFRSHKTALGMKPGARPKGFVKDAQDSDVIKELTAQISRMAAIGDVEMCSTPPKGTLPNIINDRFTVFVEAADIDIAGNIKKLEKTKASCEGTISSYQKKMSAADYETKVPEDIRKVNAEKLVAAQKELEEVGNALKSLQDALK